MYTRVTNGKGFSDFGLIIRSSKKINFLKGMKNLINYTLESCLSNKTTYFQKVPNLLILGDKIDKSINMSINDLIHLASQFKAGEGLAEEPGLGIQLIFDILVSDPRASEVTTIILEVEAKRRYMVFCSKSYQTWKIGSEVNVEIL